ncbi:MAG: hypothetical protein IK130_11215 [Oscillospiraceae bacterium]|nr:hypothetical protein [Oscillospiraceae bacterium]
MGSSKYIANNDLSAAEDFLGMKDQFEGLAKFIRQCSTPMTVAIQGDWGTGKTTAMNNIRRIILGDPVYDLSDTTGLVQAEIDRRARVNLKESELTIWFNTWQFSVLSDSDRLILDLLYMIVNMLQERMKAIKECSPDTNSEEQTKEMDSVVGKLAKGVVGFLVTSGKFLVKQSDEVSGFLETFSDFPLHEQMKKGKDADPLAVFQSMQSNASFVVFLKEMLEETIRKLLEITKKDRIYFFIDDLDRLKPQIAVELLECMKNFLDCEGCVFVLAIDQDVIERGLRSKYGEDFDRDYAKRASQFFDKIIQVPFNLPTYSYKLEGYVEKLLKNSVIADEPAAFVKIIKMFGETNPRTIKRSFNLLELYCLMRREPPASVVGEYAFVLLMIRSRTDFGVLSRMLSRLTDPDSVQEEFFDALRSDSTLLQSKEISALFSVFEISTVFADEDADEAGADQSDRIREMLANFREISETIAETPDEAQTVPAEEIAQRMMHRLRTRLHPDMSADAEWSEGSSGERLFCVRRADGSTAMRLKLENNNIHLTVYKTPELDTEALFRDAEDAFGEIPNADDAQFGYYGHNNYLILPRLPRYSAGCAIDTLLKNAGILR